MRRDMDLVRGILVNVADAKGVGTGELMFLVGEPTEENHQLLNYHLKMLVEDAGLLKGIERTSVNAGGFFDYLYLSLPWEGNDFLDAVKDETTWTKTKSIAAQAGGWTAKTLLDIGKAVAADAVKAAMRQHGLL
jgi:hypothetical protein